MTTPTPEFEPTWVPQACTLPTVEQPLRLAEFEELFSTAVRGVTRPSRDSLQLDLEVSPGIAAQAADLMTRETGCCSFFTFRLSAIGDRLSLEISVPPSQLDVLDAIGARVSAGEARS